MLRGNREDSALIVEPLDQIATANRHPIGRLAPNPFEVAADWVVSQRLTRP
jgi:hypothetical protein